MLIDYEARFGIPRLKPWTEHLDDKWLFHPHFFKKLAANLGLIFHGIFPLNTNLDNIITNSVLTTIKLAGLDSIPKPEALYKELKYFDDQFSSEMKEKFSLEGIIIFEKNNFINNFAIQIQDLLIKVKDL